MARRAEGVLVVREAGSGTRAAIERQFAALGLTVCAGGEFGTNEAIKQAVRAGLGVAVVSAQTIELELQTGCLAVADRGGGPALLQAPAPNGPRPGRASGPRRESGDVNHLGLP